MATRRLLLLGDFVRLAYQPEVERLLRADSSADVEVVGPAASCGSSVNLMEHIDVWVRKFQPDLVHFNAGLDDVVWLPEEGRNATQVGQYELNLKWVVDFLRSRFGSDFVFATTTPVHDAVAQESPNQRCNRDIEEYNIAACEIMLQADVLINPLDRVIWQQDDTFIAEDGVSLTPAGTEAAAKSVVQHVLSLWH